MAVLDIAIRSTFDNKGVVEAEKGTRDLSETIKKNSESIGKSFGSIGEGTKQVGENFTKYVTAPLVGIGVAVTKFATDFNAEMANVASLGLAPERVNELKKNVQEMAVSVGKDTGDLARGLYQVVSAFGDTADTAKILEINARAAAAGLATTEEAIALTSAVTKGYGDTSAAAVTKVADLAFQTVKLGQTTFPELASSIGRVTPIAAELGIAQEELFAVMATGTGVTGTASEVSTQLRGILQSLMAPTGDMTELLDDMGFATGKAMLEQLGLQESIETIIKVANDSGRPLQGYIGSIEGQTLALTLAGSQSVTFTEKMAAMAKVAGSTDEAFKAQTAGINANGFAMAQLRSEVQVMAQKLGDALAPALKDVIELVKPMVAWVMESIKRFSEMDDSQKKLIITIAAVAAAIGPVLVVLGTLFSALGTIITVGGTVVSALAGAGGVAAALGFLLNPIGLVVAAVGALAVAWARDWGGIRSETESKLNTIGGMIGTWANGIVRNWQTFTGNVQQTWATAWANVDNAFRNQSQTISRSVGTASTDWLKTAAGTLQYWSGIGRDMIGNTLLGIKNNVAVSISGIKDWALSMLKTAGDTLKSWVDVGKNIMAGIWDGLKSAAATPLKWIGDFGRNLIYEAKRILGIRSPSTEFFALGEWTLEGFLAGLESSGADTYNWMDDFAGSLDSPFAPTDFLGLGSSMMGNLYTGLQAGSGAVIDLMKDIHGRVIGSRDWALAEVAAIEQKVKAQFAANQQLIAANNAAEAAAYAAQQAAKQQAEQQAQQQAQASAVAAMAETTRFVLNLTNAANTHLAKVGGATSSGALQGVIASLDLLRQTAQSNASSIFRDPTKTKEWEAYTKFASDISVKISEITRQATELANAEAASAAATSQSLSTVSEAVRAFVKSTYENLRVWDSDGVNKAVDETLIRNASAGVLANSMMSELGREAQPLAEMVKNLFSDGAMMDQNTLLKIVQGIAKFREGTIKSASFYGQTPYSQENISELNSSNTAQVINNFMMSYNTQQNSQSVAADIQLLNLLFGGR
jgi:TP901 family phage tail tape measure protein